MRFAAHTREVVEAELLNDEAAVLGFDDQLRVDERAFRLQVDRLQDPALEQLEREVDVAMRPAEEHTDQRVVNVRVNGALQSFNGAIETIAGNHVGAGELQRTNGAPN